MNDQMQVGGSVVWLGDNGDVNVVVMSFTVVRVLFFC